MANEKLKSLVDDLNEYLSKRHPVFKERFLSYSVVKNSVRILFDKGLIYTCEGFVDWQALLDQLQKEAAVKNALHEMVSTFFKHADEKVMKEKYGIEG
ncbi:hypothetical protein LCGC14_0987050 [marine sediment metagenome]|uniref:Uncharacterized protein n=1 Tax=marine sediment metagenome TaxID=412755 RepID=A0A0F9NBJ7_9ZZZZ